MKKIDNILFCLIILILFNSCTNPSTPAGHEGYVKENPRIWGKGGFRGIMKGPANFGVSLLLDEKNTQIEIAKKDAEIRIEEAKGIAEAQRIINSTLTVNYLQHEAINAQLKMAASPNHTTVYIPSGANGIPLIKNIDK